MAELSIEDQVQRAALDGIRDGIKSRLTQSYNNPLDKMVEAVIAKHDAEFRKLLTEALASAFANETLREEIRSSIRHKLAQVLVARFGGELEKQVNLLKSDPVTRARITVALEEIVKERASALTA